MTLAELKAAIDSLIEQGIPDDEPVAVEFSGECLEINSMAVVITSDLWVPETVVLTVGLIDGAADDG